MLLAFTVGAIAARLLGPKAFGEFAYALAVAGAAAVPASIGLPAAATRFISVYSQRGEWSLARGLRRFADGVTGLVSLILGAGMLAIGLAGWQGTRLRIFLLAAPVVFLLAGINLRQKTLQGLEYPVAAQLPLQVIKPSLFLIMAGAAWIAERHAVRTPDGMMSVWLVSVGLAWVAAELLVRHHGPPVLQSARPSYDARRWVAVALPMLLADSAGVLQGQTDTLVLGALRSAAEVGRYAVALRTAAVLTVLLGASNWVLAPWFARLHEKGSRRRLQTILTRTTRSVFGATILLFAALVAWGQPLLEAVFGSGFGAAYPVLIILGAAQLVNVGVGPVVNLLAMTGGQKALALTAGVAALANLAGSVVLIPRFGAIGAATSFGASLVLMKLVLARIVRQRLALAAGVVGRRSR